MIDDAPSACPDPDKQAIRHQVLLVDDQLIIVEAVRRMLAKEADIDYHYATDATQAVASALRVQPTLILQDLVMPGADGFTLIAAYRTMPTLARVPVIVLSAKEDSRLKAHGFAVGANDYVVKLPDQLELVARVRYHSGAYINGLQRDCALRELQASRASLAAANVELEKLAAMDGLTGIGNRRRFDQVMQQEWLRGQRDEQEMALLLCDIDHFKLYNDALGHQAGDLALKRVASVLTGSLKRPADLAARYGGEEFALILPATDLAGAMQIASICREQLAALAIPNPGAAQDGMITLSIGVASTLPSAKETPADLIARADKALYAAKSGGRNRICAAP